MREEHAQGVAGPVGKVIHVVFQVELKDKAQHVIHLVPRTFVVESVAAAATATQKHAKA
jgi:hypothetical protein